MGGATYWQLLDFICTAQKMSYAGLLLVQWQQASNKTGDRVGLQWGAETAQRLNALG